MKKYICILLFGLFSAVMFGQEIEPMSFVYATVISLAFTLLVSLIMRPRIRKIDMVESMKATD